MKCIKPGLLVIPHFPFPAPVPQLYISKLNLSQMRGIVH